MIVNSLRLGPIEVPEEKLIAMERPILGFEKLRQFCLIEMDEMAPFMWLQSVEDPAVAFLVCNPIVFFPDYRIEINSMEIAELEVADVQAVETYVIVTIMDGGKDLSANLQGPILINTGNSKAKQIVLVNSEYQVRHSLIAAVESPTEGVSAEEAEEPVAV